MDLIDDDKETLRRCLEVAASGRIFEDPEFHALFGLQRSEFGAIFSKWPNVDWTDPDVDLAVNNTLANLLGYPHGKDLASLVGADRDHLEALSQRWRERAPWSQ
jgi:hypothetical protein